MKCLAPCKFNYNNECTLRGMYITLLGNCSEILFIEVKEND